MIFKSILKFLSYLVGAILLYVFMIYFMLATIVIFEYVTKSSFFDPKYW